MINLIQKIDKGLDKFTSFLLIIVVISMLLLSVFGIVVRWGERSFLWLDPLVRHLVFASAFLGGVIATGRKTHIGIEILPKVLENKGMVKEEKIVRIFISLISAGVLGWLVKASYDFFLIELKYGKEVFFGIHSGVLVFIIPCGFFLIGVRFALQSIIQTSQLNHSKEESA